MKRMTGRMRTGQNVIMVFVLMTSTAIGAGARIMVTDNMINWKNVMGPFNPKNWTMVGATTEGGVVIPVNVASGRPQTRANDEVMHRLFVDGMANTICKTSGDDGATNDKSTLTCRKEQDRRGWSGLFKCRCVM